MQIPKDYIGRLGPEHQGVAVFAWDFDGTLCEDAYPKIGAPKKEMIEYAKSLKAQGHKIILFTCRENEILDDALAWCRMQFQKISPFDAVNENLPELIEKFGSDCRKISADFYVDVDSIKAENEEEEVDAILKEYPIHRDSQLIRDISGLIDNYNQPLKCSRCNTDPSELSGVPWEGRACPCGGEFKYRSDNSPEKEQESILAEAARIVEGDKMIMYGPPEYSYEQIALVWNALLRKKIENFDGPWQGFINSKDVALMYIGAKDVREANKPKRDNLVDIAGNVRCAERIDAVE